MSAPHFESDPAPLLADATVVAQAWMVGEDINLQLEPREATWLTPDGVPTSAPAGLDVLSQQMAHQVHARTTLHLRRDGHEVQVVDLAWLEGRDYRQEHSLLRRLARVPTLLRRLGAQGVVSTARVAATTADKRALHDAILAGHADGLWCRPRSHPPMISGTVFLRRAEQTVRVDRRDPEHVRAVFVELPTPEGCWRRLGRVMIPAGVDIPGACTWIRITTEGMPRRFLKPRYLGPCARPACVPQFPSLDSDGDPEHG